MPRKNDDDNSIHTPAKGEDDEFRLNVRDILYESMAYFGTLKLLNNLLLLCIIYYLGIAHTRMQKRSLQKSLISDYFVPEKPKIVHSSESELRKFYIEKVNAVLNDHAIPDPTSVPLFASFEFMASDCGIKSQPSGAVKFELVSNRPWCESKRSHDIYIFKSLNETFGKPRSYTGMKIRRRLSAEYNYNDPKARENNKIDFYPTARFGNVSAIDFGRYSYHFIIPFLLGNEVDANIFYLIHFTIFLICYL